MQIYFESGANFITAANNAGNVKIRCPFQYTDCGENEDLRDFVKRHDGEIATRDYLEECYEKATRI